MARQKWSLFFDSMVWDEMTHNSGPLRAFLDAHGVGLIEIVRSHVGMHQNEKRSDKTKLAAIRELRKKLGEHEIPTAGVGLNVSKLDRALMGDQKDNEFFGALMGKKKSNTKHGADALIVTSAANQNMILVTGDRSLYNQMKSRGATSIWLKDFQHWLLTKVVACRQI